jgi:NADH:ubiquinone oxidoreductase subunit 6 (subunit J)
MTETITFWLLAALTVIPALFVVTSRNIFRAGLWLLPTLLGVAGFFLVLGSDFLWAVQMLIYIGGVMVLLLFAILLTRHIADPDAVSHNGFAGWAAFFAIMIGIVLAVSLHSQFKTIAPVSATPPAGDTASIGNALLTTYLLPFEVASVLLLAAIIGAIVIARGDKQR